MTSAGRHEQARLLQTFGFFCMQGEGIAYGTKEGRLRMLQHELVPPGKSSAAAAETPRPEETSVQQLSQDVFAEDDQ